MLVLSQREAGLYQRVGLTAQAGALSLVFSRRQCSLPNRDCLPTRLNKPPEDSGWRCQRRLFSHPVVFTMPIAPTALTLPSHQECNCAEIAPTAAAALSVQQDWDLPFNAVTARLRDVAGMVSALPGLATMPQSARARVLECAQALEQLHDSLSQQKALQAALHEQLLGVHGSLEQSRDELADNQNREKRQRHHAQQDTLTTLPNRSHFRNLLMQALATTEPQRAHLALLYVDLDGFKLINDLHGRDVGDRLLRIVATRLTRAIRSGDCVGRMGSDEFVCLLGLMQRPSMRMDSREPSSWANAGVIFLPRKPATRGASAASTA